DEPDALADLRDADVLAGEDVTEVDLAAVEADPAAVRHREGGVGKRVAHLFEAAITPRRSRVALGRELHVERLVRALVVVARAERIEASLLLQDVWRGWLGGFGLERAVHPLVPAVLLGMAGLNSLDPNPQS